MTQPSDAGNGWKTCERCGCQHRRATAVCGDCRGALRWEEIERQEIQDAARGPDAPS